MTFETAPDSQKSRSIAFDLHLWPHIINFCSLLYFFQIVDILSFPMMCNITILLPFEKWLKWVSKYSHFNYLCVFCHMIHVDNLKIVEMRAIWKKSSENRKHLVLWKSYTYLQLWFFDLWVTNCHKTVIKIGSSYQTP